MRGGIVSGNRSNAYAEAIEPKLYARIPKAVLAAVAVSILSNGGDDLDGASARILEEWEILHANGIVPQGVAR